MARCQDSVRDGRTIDKWEDEREPWNPLSWTACNSFFLFFFTDVHEDRQYLEETGTINDYLVILTKCRLQHFLQISDNLHGIDAIYE